jgi:hypothetical protein
MSAHTKGPWVSEKEVMKDGRLFMTIRQPDVDYDIGTIAYVTLRPEEVEANARLIAAAPELMEAAQMGVIWLTAALNCSLWVWDGDQREAAEAELAKMNAAIAKAVQS